MQIIRWVPGHLKSSVKHRGNSVEFVPGQPRPMMEGEEVFCWVRDESIVF